MSHDILGLLGQTVENRYAIIRILGQGGCGTTYEARDSKLARTVAIKVLHLTVDPKQPEKMHEIRQRFLREARSLASKPQAGVVTVHDCGELEKSGTKYPFMVLELLQGTDLEALMKSGAEPVDICRWGLVLAQTLAALHERGIVHRDIKPANIMLQDDRPVLIDFGIAYDAAQVKRQGRLSSRREPMGTPVFMAPEQIDPKPDEVPSPQVDVYALGATLYALFAGALPYREQAAEGYLPVLQAKMGAVSPRGLLEVRAETGGKALAPKLVKIVQRAMAHNLDERYASASELAEALESYLRPREPPAPEPAPPLPVLTPLAVAAPPSVAPEPVPEPNCAAPAPTAPAHAAPEIAPAVPAHAAAVPALDTGPGASNWASTPRLILLGLLAAGLAGAIWGLQPGANALPEAVALPAPAAPRPVLTLSLTAAQATFAGQPSVHLRLTPEQSGTLRLDDPNRDRLLDLHYSADSGGTIEAKLSSGLRLTDATGATLSGPQRLSAGPLTLRVVRGAQTVARFTASARSLDAGSTVQAAP